MHQTAKPSPPVPLRKPKKLSRHGDTRIDPYYWMRERDDPEVLAQLEAENSYTEACLAHTKDLQDKLFAEITGRIKQDDSSVPYLDNGYYYLRRYEEGQEYPIYARKKGSLDAEEEIMLDVNALAEGYSYFHVGGRSVSADNRLLAFGEDTVSRRIYTLRFKDLTSGELLPDEIHNTTGNAAWAADNATVFYTQKDPQTLRGYRIMRHRLGEDPATDQVVFTEEDPTYLTFVYRSKSREYIIIGSYANMSHEYRVLRADNPEGTFRIIQPRKHGLEYDIAYYDGQFFIRTNWKARNFRLMAAPEDKPGIENWQELIPHRPDVLLEDMDVFRDHLVLSERRAGITRLRIRPWSGPEHYVPFEEEAYLAYTAENPAFDTEWLRINYQSMTTPPTVYDYHMRTGEFRLRKRQEVLGGFRSEDYHTERLTATARDGAQVPISIVYRKEFKRNGQAPLLLYGYGSYGHSLDPYFSLVRPSLLDRGFAFAIAHVRGGEELGRAWYEQGKLLHKKNTFYDFIDCAEFLVREKYTTPQHLYAMGGSAGGLLMGAVVNLRPDLWKGVVAQVPFVDVLTTMLDDSIPLTTGEYDEWGDPNDPEYYQYIKSYSPYDNVEARDYPAILATTGLHDSQVQYWEPAKWVARLRQVKLGDEPVYLHTNLEAGHGGASGRFSRFKDTALEYAFLLDLEGIAK